MQEIKVDIIPNMPGNVAKLLKTYLNQGYIIDSFYVEGANALTQNEVITTVLHKEKSDNPWN